jgi:aminopeptidase N
MGYPQYRLALLMVHGLLLGWLAMASNQSWGESTTAQVCRYCQEHHQGQSEGNMDDRPGRKYAVQRDADIVHLKIDVTPDFDHRSIRGTTTIRFIPVYKPLTELRLNGVALNVEAVRSPDGIRDFAVGQEYVTVTFASPLPVGKESQIEIDYQATPQMGLYFRTPKMGYKESDTHLWTQGETHEARHWFPCFDHPNERASTEVICRIPPSMNAFSNGELLSEELDPKSGLKAVHWMQRKPHASYLVCLVAGHFKSLEAKHRDISLKFHTQPSLIEHAHNAFADTPQIMAYFEEEIGLNFPWHKYDQVTIADFMWGGMENTSLTTLTQGTIHSSETENIHTSYGLDAHEMAHQWFGDYVTCQDWSHLWLNEGFATYYSHLYEGHKFGRDQLLYGLYNDAEGNILRQVDDKRPIVYRDYGASMEQFDYRSYPKGSWVLHMLRSQMGQDVYRQAIRQYLERHALGNATTPDLKRVIEEVTGRSWDAFFDQWLYRPRFPDIRVDYAWSAEDKLAEVKIRQTHTVDNDVPVYHFPVTLRFIVGDKVIDERVDVDAMEKVVMVPLPEQPRIVRFDPEYSLLARVTMELPEKMLLEQLVYQPDVIGRLRAVEALKGRKSSNVVEALTKTLREDPFHGVRLEACDALSSQGSDAAIAALEGSLSQADARVRNRVVSALARIYRPETLQKLQQIIDQEKNPAIIADAIRGLAKFQNDESRKRLRAMLYKDSYNHEIALAAIDAMRAHDDPAFVPDVMAWIQAKRGDIGRRQLGQAVEAASYLAREDEDKESVRKLLQELLHDSNPWMQIAGIRGLATLRDRGSNTLIQAMSASGDRRVATAATEALKSLDTEVEKAPKEVQELREALRKVQDEQASLKKVIEELTAKLKAKEAVAEPVATPTAETPAEPSKGP